MAFTALGANSGSINSKTANQSSAAISRNLTLGNLFVYIIAVDNNQTTDGDEGAVTSITDTSGNTWLKAAEFTNGQGSAQAGATCSIWYSVITSGGATTITANFSNSASRDASACCIYDFSFDPGSTIAVEATNTLANDGADPDSLNAVTANIACLRVRGIAAETNSTTALTTTPGWTSFDNNQTSGGGSAANIAVRGEFIISTGTGAASDPSYAAADCASVYVAFKEVSSFTWYPMDDVGINNENIIRPLSEMVAY